MKHASIIDLLRQLLSDDRGAAASEYAISLAFIALAVAAAASQFNLTEAYSAVVSTVSGLVS